MIGALESGGRSASVDHFRQSFSARRSRVEQADPRLRALDRYDGQLQSRISQFALGGGDTSGLESIANSLQDQPGVIGQVFEVAEALAGFNGDLSGGFLERIQQGLSGLAQVLGPGGSGVQATRLDLSLSFQSDSLEFSSTDGETQISASSQRIEINVRFLSLNAQSEPVEPVEPIRAGIGGRQATLEGLGPLAQFDFNGDGQFDFGDFEALAGGLFGA